jgi:hypothetical protein
MNSRFCLVMVSMLAMLFLGLTGCGPITIVLPGGTPPTTNNPPGSVTPSVTPPSTPAPNLPSPNPADNAPSVPVINLFSATPGNIVSGGSTTLSWDVSNASAISITPGIGPVGFLNGSAPITPASTTDYTLTASNDQGTVSAVTSVGVFTIVGLPVINSFVATPPSFIIGGSTLSWNVSNAASISITPVIGPVGSTGSTSVNPASTTIYTLTASNPAGSVFQTIQVTRIILQVQPKFPLEKIPSKILPLNPVLPKFPFPIQKP